MNTFNQTEQQAVSFLYQAISHIASNEMYWQKIHEFATNKLKEFHFLFSDISSCKTTEFRETLAVLQTLSFAGWTNLALQDLAIRTCNKIKI